jgi:hypothetical protein
MVSAPAEARLDGNEPLNGNQELISHPSLPYVYYGGSAEVTAFNFQSAATISQALSGASGYVSSMDISYDGTVLAAALESTIYILNLTSGVPSSTSTVNSMGGIIKSLCFGPGNNLYVTYESSNLIDAYTTTAYVGNVGSAGDAGDVCILETDDAKSVLLAGNMGSVDATTIIKYSITADPTVALSETGRYVSSTGKLAQFEASADKIYTACTGAAGIQAVSLSTMTLEATTFPMLQKPCGVALSRDGSVVYGVSAGGASGTYPTGQAAIYAFDPTGKQLSVKYVNYQAGPIAPTGSDWVVATASPLKLETIGPEIKAGSPTAGAVYTYSPGYIRFNVTLDPVVDASAITATVDGTSYPAVRMGSDVYQINLTSALAAGDHTVNVNVRWGDMSVPFAWTFTSGSTSASALRPTLSLIDPAPSTSTNISPSQIVLGVGMPAPPPFKTNITVTLNNVTLSAVADRDDPARYIAALPSGLDLIGSNRITANANVDGFIVTGSWDFEVTDETTPGVKYDTITYGENFSIPSPENWTEQKDFGGWEIAITGPSFNSISTNVFVDIAHDPSVRANQAFINTYAQTVLSDTIDGGDPAEMIGDVNYTAISNLTAGVWKIRLIDQGVQEAYALIVDEVNGDRWLIKCSASDTNFIDIWPNFEHMISGVHIEAEGITPVVIPPATQGYAYYRMLGDYQLIVPDNWTIKREAVSGETTVSLKLTGPKVGEFHVTILLQNGTDPSVLDDRASLLAWVQTQFLPELQAKGIEASIYEEARILSISNHTALVFSIKWTDLQNNMSVVQEIYYIVDEGNQRYWMFTCESPEEAYPTYVQIFDKVAQSFTPLSRSSTTATNGGLFSDPTTVLMIAVLAVTGVAATIVFLVAQRYRSKP